MHTWTDLVTTIDDLLTLATAAINLAAAIKTRPGPGHNEQDQHGGCQQPDKR